MSDDVVTEETDEVTEAEETEYRMSLTVDMEDIGPCRKKVKVVVPRADLDHFRDQAVDELSDRAEVPGFRPGNVPKQLVLKRFKSEIGDQVKQNVLISSLEQLAEEHELDPINEPNLDVEDLDIPDEGDFDYQFEVEVRPDFDLPDYSGLTIDRPTRDVSDEEVGKFMTQYLSQYGERKVVEEAAKTGDFVTVDIKFTSGDKELNSLSGVNIELKPSLRFTDAELEDFDKLMEGAKADDQREAEVTVSAESENIEMRGEKVVIAFEVKSVMRLEMPEMNKEFFERVGVENEGEMKDNIRDMLERQLTFQQRQSAREQVLSKITASADWDLPEDLVLKQTENALRREVLEMQQAGFTQQQIAARENEIRSKAVSTTRQALKEHFVLDRIASKENIECEPTDIETEITMMAMQRGESPRRVRARMQKSGMIENLEAQIRERKAIDHILDSAEFKDVPAPAEDEYTAASLAASVCSTAATTTEVEAPAEDDE
ncbi:MAG: trigger factor [Planctomycetaceae bacterium]